MVDHRRTPLAFVLFDIVLVGGGFWLITHGYPLTGVFCFACAATTTYRRKSRAS